MKQKDLNRWFWKWHVIAGLISLPIMILLSVTGILYLFKADYNNNIYQDILFVDAVEQGSATVSFQSQLDRVQGATDHHIMQLQLPQTATQATGFRVHAHGGGHARNMIYTNPYTGDITGEIKQKETLMYTIRKLHGELLLNKPGTLTVELISSWFIVLIFTGLYVWWPSKRFESAGFFTVRTKKGRRIFWRDMHAVVNFWLSILMLLILSGGMPWTDMFGSELRWVQEKTESGYPSTWRSAKGLNPTSHGATPLDLDQIVSIAKKQNLTGQISIKFPIKQEGVFTVSNRALWLSDQKLMHFNRYSGELIKAHNWSDVGILMDLRQVMMRLHQGEYGFVNWLIVLLIVALFTLSTSAALVSYLIRKPKGRWGLPKTPAQFTVGKALIVSIIIFSFVFPMFGLSLIVVLITEKILTQNKKDLVLSS